MKQIAIVAERMALGAFGPFVGPTALKLVAAVGEVHA